jgi:hypothetical protein
MRTYARSTTNGRARALATSQPGTKTRGPRLMFPGQARTRLTGRRAEQRSSSSSRAPSPRWERSGRVWSEGREQQRHHTPVPHTKGTLARGAFFPSREPLPRYDNAVHLPIVGSIISTRLLSTEAADGTDGPSGGGSQQQPQQQPLPLPRKGRKGRPLPRKGREGRLRPTTRR